MEVIVLSTLKTLVLRGCQKLHNHNSQQETPDAISI